MYVIPFQRILLIDDDPINNFISSQTIKTFLKRTDLDIVAFTSSQEGMEYIKIEYSHRPVITLLLLDINMPDFTGWDVLDAIGKLDRQIQSYLRIYLLSSSIDPSDMERAGSNPLVQRYLVKPMCNHLTAIFSDAS